MSYLLSTKCDNVIINEEKVATVYQSHVPFNVAPGDTFHYGAEQCSVPVRDAKKTVDQQNTRIFQNKT